MTQVLRERTASLVEHTAKNCGLSRELRTRTHRYLAISAVLFLTPFAINNFYQDRALMGGGSVVIILILLFNCRRLGGPSCVPYGLARVLVGAITLFVYLCFKYQGALAVFWCYPSVIVFYFILPELQARAINVAALVVLVPEMWRHLTPALATRATVTLILVSLFSAIFICLLGQQQRRLRELAVKDPLTGVFNRLLLDTFLERSCVLAQRTDQDASLISIDLDHFKKINDTFGHEAGDRVLRELGSLLINRVRRSDAVFRIGGEEFLLLLMGANEKSAAEVAEQVRLLIRESTLLPGCRVTASLGVAALTKEESWSNWIKRSDVAVYRAKAAGRDQVRTAQPVL
jgi:diguanylate cyclase (GGDEF)-like protein